jgi:hypothetical protein
MVGRRLRKPTMMNKKSTRSSATGEWFRHVIRPDRADRARRGRLRLFHRGDLERPQPTTLIAPRFTQMSQR